MASKEKKLSEFREFKFESDERWKSYLNAVEIPAGKEAVAKAKWYKRNVDPDFEVEWATSGSSSSSSSTYTRPTTSTSSSSTGGAQQQQQQQDARPPPPTHNPFQQPPPFGPGGFMPPPRTPSPAQQRRIFFMHLGTLLLLLAHLLPFIPFLPSRRAYRFCLMLAAATHGYKVACHYGGVKLWPIKAAWPNLQAWLMRVLPASDFFYAIVGTTFHTAPPITLLALPLGVLALFHVDAYAATHLAGHPLWARVDPWHRKLLGFREHALQACAMCEVATGFLLLLQLISPSRNLLLLMFWWQMLKMRFHASDAKMYHEQAWQRLDAQTRTIRARVPILEKVVGYARNWFLALR